jgi:hypothetical protein
MEAAMENGSNGRYPRQHGTVMAFVPSATVSDSVGVPGQQGALEDF